MLQDTVLLQVFSKQLKVPDYLFLLVWPAFQDLVLVCLGGSADWKFHVLFKVIAIMVLMKVEIFSELIIQSIFKIVGS